MKTQNAPDTVHENSGSGSNPKSKGTNRPLCSEHAVPHKTNVPIGLATIVCETTMSQASAMKKMRKRINLMRFDMSKSAYMVRKSALRDDFSFSVEEIERDRVLYFSNMRDIRKCLGIASSTLRSCIKKHRPIRLPAEYVRALREKQTPMSIPSIDPDKTVRRRPKKKETEKEEEVEEEEEDSSESEESEHDSDDDDDSSICEDEDAVESQLTTWIVFDSCQIEYHFGKRRYELSSSTSDTTGDHGHGHVTSLQLLQENLHELFESFPSRSVVLQCLDRVLKYAGKHGEQQVHRRFGNFLSTVSTSHTRPVQCDLDNINLPSDARITRDGILFMNDRMVLGTSAGNRKRIVRLFQTHPETGEQLSTRKSVPIAYLVYNSWVDHAAIEVRPEFVEHIDGDISNDDFDNLRWNLHAADREKHAQICKGHTVRQKRRRETLDAPPAVEDSSVKIILVCHRTTKRIIFIGDSVETIFRATYIGERRARPIFTSKRRIINVPYTGTMLVNDPQFLATHSIAMPNVLVRKKNDVRNRSGKKPLHWVYKYGSKEVFEKLMKTGTTELDGYIMTIDEETSFVYSPHESNSESEESDSGEEEEEEEEEEEDDV